MGLGCNRRTKVNMESTPMNLHQYAEQCSALASELNDSLSETDQSALDRWFGEHDQEAWWAWREGREEIVVAYVSATASERARKKAYREHQPKLTLAAIQHCLEGQALLRVIENLEAGRSYRNMAALAGQAYQDLMGSYIPQWPFEGDTPFV